MKIEGKLVYSFWLFSTNLTDDSRVWQVSAMLKRWFNISKIFLVKLNIKISINFHKNWFPNLLAWGRKSSTKIVLLTSPYECFNNVDADASQCFVAFKLLQCCSVLFQDFSLNVCINVYVTWEKIENFFTVFCVISFPLALKYLLKISFRFNDNAREKSYEEQLRKGANIIYFMCLF